MTSDGGLMLVDKDTGYWIALEAFGPDNYREFRAMFDAVGAFESRSLQSSDQN